jgi:hypothetical protein
MASEVLEIRDEVMPTTYPQVGVFVTPLGLTVRIVLAPGLIISQDVNKDVMDQVVAQWHKLYPEVDRKET